MGDILGSIAGPITSLFGGSSAQSDNAQAVSSQDAFGPYRSGLASLVNGLITNPNGATSDPGYGFGLQQGSQTVQGSAAASGQLNSGNTLSALSKFGTGYAQQNWLNDINSISNIAQGNPAYAGITAQGNLANTAGQVSALGGGFGIASSLLSSSGSGGGGGFFGSLFGGSGGAASGATGDELLNGIT